MDKSFYVNALEKLEKDVVLKGTNGEQYEMHSILLSSVSPVLSAMLNSKMKEGREKKIVLDVPPFTLRNFTKMLYEGELPEKSDIDLYFNLYQFFDRYDISSKSITDKIIKITNEDNIIKHFQKWFEFSNSNEELLQRLALKLGEYLRHNSKVVSLFKGLEQFLPFNNLNLNPSFIKFMESFVETHDFLSAYPIVCPRTDPRKLVIQQTVDDIYLELTSSCTNSYEFGMYLFNDTNKARIFYNLFQEYENTDDFHHKNEIMRKIIEFVFEDDIKQGVMSVSEIIDYLTERIESDHDPIYFRESKCYSVEDFIMKIQIHNIPEKMKKLYINIKNFEKVWEFDLPSHIFKSIFDPQVLDVEENLAPVLKINPRTPPMPGRRITPSFIRSTCDPSTDFHSFSIL